MDEPTKGSGVTRYVIAAVALGVVSVVLAAQNSASVPVEVLTWTARPPLYAVAAVSALFGSAVAEIIGGIWRHRRHVRNRERIELSDLRRHADHPGPPPGQSGE